MFINGKDPMETIVVLHTYSIVKHWARVSSLATSVLFCQMPRPEKTVDAAMEG